MDTLKQALEKILEHFKGEISSLRTGRATPALVEDIEVEYYGVKTPLKAVASISSPGPRELVIQPWDKGVLQAIEKGIQASNLGINPIADKDTIRLTLPQLTEERRKDFVKLLGKYTEESRIKVRREREDALRDLDKKGKEISDDEKFRQKNEIQKVVDDINRKIEEASASKEKEVLTV